MDECSQKTCSRPAQYKYFWPGEPPRFSCAECLPKITKLGSILGIAVPILPHNQTQREQIPTSLSETTE
jgi:hypothetical protein